MKLKGDQSTTRAINRRLVLDCLRRQNEMSRVEIAGKTRLSQAAISAVVAELLADNYVEETEAGQSSGGRRPILLRINYAAHYSIGLKVSHDVLHATLTDLSTEPLRSLDLPLANHFPQTLAEVAAHAVLLLLPDEAERKAKLIGVGLGLSGLIDVERGICLISHRYGWKDVPIAAMLARHIDAPVWVDNDANAYAIAQHLFGFGRMHRSVLALVNGTGIGAGLILNGLVHRGARYAAGEVGRAYYETSDSAEGNFRQNWESVLSEWSMVAWWKSHLETTGRRAEPDLADAAAAGDQHAIDYLRWSGRELGLRLATMIDLVDPEIVVLGGEIVRFGRVYTDAMLDAVKLYSFETPPPVEIDWENNLWPRGASALAIQRFFDFESAEGLKRLPK